MCRCASLDAGVAFCYSIVKEKDAWKEEYAADLPASRGWCKPGLENQRKGAFETGLKMSGHDDMPSRVEPREFPSLCWTGVSFLFSRESLTTIYRRHRG
ncbi:MAG: hypothetical protein DDT21_01232 [Syntrophomonadaceae bacterium]|nr:hypothetical protein [Bacillota bacterium]